MYVGSDPSTVSVEQQFCNSPGTFKRWLHVTLDTLLHGFYLGTNATLEYKVLFIRYLTGTERERTGR